MTATETSRAEDYEFDIVKLAIEVSMPRYLRYWNKYRHLSSPELQSILFSLTDQRKVCGLIVSYGTAELKGSPDERSKKRCQEKLLKYAELRSREVAVYHLLSTISIAPMEEPPKVDPSIRTPFIEAVHSPFKDSAPSLLRLVKYVEKLEEDLNRWIGDDQSLHLDPSVHSRGQARDRLRIKPRGKQAHRKTEIGRQFFFMVRENPEIKLSHIKRDLLRKINEAVPEERQICPRTLERYIEEYRG